MSGGTLASGPRTGPGRRFVRLLARTVFLASAAAALLVPASPAGAATYAITPGGPPVTVTIAAPNENQFLTFTGTAGQRISLKIGPACCSTRVSITKPDGTTLVGATSVGTSGGYIDTRTLPLAGTYTILVDPQTSATGNVTLTLYDVPPDVTGTIVPGGAATTVTTTTPGQNARLTFNGTAGRRVSLTIGPTCCSTRISILNPSGTTLVAPKTFTASGGFLDTKTLPVSGTYTIVVDPQSSALGSVMLTLHDVPPDAVAAIVPGGSPVTVTTSTPGQNAKATFAGTAGQRVSLRIGPLCCRTNVSITRPDGDPLVGAMSVSPSGGFIDTRTLPISGTYTIFVDPQSFAVGDVTLTLYNVPPDSTGTIVPGGASVTVGIATPGQNARLTFTGTAGRRISLNMGNVTIGSSQFGGTRVSILNPDGTSFVSAVNVGTAGQFIDTTMVPASGTYTIVIDPQSSNTGSMTLTLYDVPADVTGTIVIGGAAATVTTTTPGQNATLTFDGAAGQRISLKVGPACCSTKVSILRPDGTALVGATSFSTSGGFVDAKTLPVSGTYTIVVDPQSFAVGSVTLTLYDLPPDVTGTIAPGGPPVTVTTATSGQNARLTFTGTAGRAVSLNMSDVTIGPSLCCSTKVSILKPDGTAFVAPMNVGTTGAFVDAKTLPTTGTYTIFIDPQSSSTGSMTLTLYDVPADATRTIVAGGGSVTLTTTVPGENARLTFAGTAGQRISLRIASCCVTKISILSPDGTALVAATSFGAGTGFVDTRTLPATGTYTIVVDPQGDATGDMTLTLYDVPPDATGTIAAGGAATVTTTTPGQNVRLTFSGTAGDGVKLALGPFNCCSTRVSILNPDGTTLVAPTAFNPDGGSVFARLPATGTYVVFVDPQGPNVGSVHLRLELDNTPPAVPILTLTESSLASHVVGTSFFYRPSGGGGTFAVGATTSDGVSGIQKVRFPGLGGGFTPTAFTDDLASPYSQTYSWTSGATYDGSMNPVAVYDRVGNISTATFAVTRDADPPVTTDDSAAIGSSWKNASQTVSLTPSDALAGVAATHYTIDGSTPTTASPLGTAVSLTAEGVWTVKYLSVDNVGNQESAKTAGTQIRIDKTRPSTATLNALPSVIRTGQVLSGSGADALSGVASISYYYCAGGNCTPSTLIGSSSTGPSYSVTWSSQPADGTYQLLARVFDVAGNSLDSAKRTVTIDNTPPNTTITASPANPTNSTSASFSFASTEAGSSFQCRLDGGAFASCTSPRAYSGLAAGSHTFEVRATDPVGNTDATPATHTWTIDLTAPDTTITATPANPTNATGASFSFTSTEAGSSFQCSLDGAAFASCTSPRSYTGLADGSHTFQVRATDPAGNTDATPASYTWTIDATAPNTTITASPANPTNATSATFSFTSTESGSTFQCRLDGAAFASCTSPQAYSGLAAGSHTFEVRATDSLGNTDPTPATHTWTVDLTAPNTTITASPPNPSNSTSPSFSYSSSEAGSTFQCALDGGVFSSCTSPRSYSGLAAGSHTFEVRATDPAGNTDATPASYTWTIDLTAPETTITSGPSDPTNSTSASFSFSSTEAGSTFQCSLDGGAYASCTSPKSYGGLAAGSHTFQVRAIDPAGNTDATPATSTWTVDVAAPNTSLTSNPANPTNQTSASFSFTSTEAGSSFQCALDGAPFSVCSSPADYTLLGEGSHTFEVKATDTAGNPDATPATYTWTVDLTAPNTTITASPANPSNSTSPSFSFTSTEAGSSFQCALDAGVFSSCASPKSYSALAAGSHTFEVRATDPAGNTDATSASYTWTVDVTAPETTITASPANPTNSTSASFGFTSSKAGSTFECRLDGAAFASCTSPRAYSGLAAGPHTFEVRATDTAGNTDATPASHAWTIDLAAPNTTVTASPANPTNATSATFSFTSTESGSSFQCALDGAPFSVCISPADYTLLGEGAHTFEVKATDPAGNTDPTPATYAWTVDLTAPETTITGSPPDPTNSATATFSFTSTQAGSSFACSLDGGAYAACTSPRTYTVLPAGSHSFEVKATDPAGNTDPTPASYTWTIDVTEPETSITSGPANPTNATSASFEFAADKAGSTFECALDGAAFAPCTSPKGYSGLAAGLHTFQVRATDVAGNTDATPATYSWRVDLTPPETTITSGPADPTSSTNASFQFSSSETGSTFECSLDGSAYEACASPKSYTGLAAGPHTFRVRATDAAGNVDASPPSASWRIDVAVPDTSILSGPASLTNSTSATFDFASTETGSTFECSLDGAAYAACESPKTYPALAAGSHSFDVRATDPAGNTDPTPAGRTWTIDVSAPPAPVIESPAEGSPSATGNFTLSGTAEAGSIVEVFDGATSKGTTTAASDGSWSKALLGVADGSHTYTATATDAAGNTSPASNARTIVVDTSPPNTTIDADPPPYQASTTAFFTFSADDPAATFECSLDGAAFAPCTSPKTYNGLSEGPHSVQVRATDSAGNTDPSPATSSWTVDLTAPAAPVIGSPADGTTNTTGTIAFSGTAEPGSFVELYDGATRLLGAATTNSSGNWSKTLTNVADGSHTYTATATDAAGNTSPASAAVTVTVDATAPNTSISASPANPTSSTSASFEFAATETGSSFECSLDGGAYEACASPKSYTGLGAGSHAFAVRATDASGNTDATPASYAWTIDVSAPETTITSSPADPTTETTAGFEFTSSEPGSTFECSLDGAAFAACTSPATYSGLAPGAHTFEVRATDQAGNTDATPATHGWTVA